MRAEWPSLPIDGPHVDDRFWIDGMAQQSRMSGFSDVRSFTPPRLLRHLEVELCRRYEVREVSHALLRSIQSVPRNKLDQCIARHRQAA